MANGQYVVGKYRNILVMWFYYYHASQLRQSVVLGNSWLNKTGVGFLSRSKILEEICLKYYGDGMVFQDVNDPFSI